MSVYRQQSTEMNDLGVIEECLKELPRAPRGIVNDPAQPRTGNFTPVRHSEPVNLIGFAGDKRAEKAQLVIPRQQCGSNDVGFLQEKKDGPVTVHISQADRHMHFSDAWLASLKSKYVNKKARKVARNTGLIFKGSKTLPNGKTRLVFVPA
jgi:hypothetical protein